MEGFSVRGGSYQRSILSSSSTCAAPSSSKGTPKGFVSLRREEALDVTSESSERETEGEQQHREGKVEAHSEGRDEEQKDGDGDGGEDEEGEGEGKEEDDDDEGKHQLHEEKLEEGASSSSSSSSPSSSSSSNREHRYRRGQQAALDFIHAETSPGGRRGPTFFPSSSSPSLSPSLSPSPSPSPSPSSPSLLVSSSLWRRLSSECSTWALSPLSIVSRSVELALESMVSFSSSSSFFFFFFFRQKDRGWIDCKL